MYAYGNTEWVKRMDYSYKIYIGRPVHVTTSGYLQGEGIYRGWASTIGDAEALFGH